MKLIKLNESKTLSAKGLKKLKANKKIKEDFEDDVFVVRVISSVVGNIYSDEFHDLIKDIIERAILTIDEESVNDVLVDDERLSTIVWEAMDEGMIYTADQWAMLHQYCTPQDADFDTAWNDMVADVERCVREILEGRLTESKDKSLKEMLIEIDEDDALDLLMNRLTHWTTDPISTDLYEEMYRSYIDGGIYDGGEFNVMSIVDNDWVNYCEVVEPGDEEHHYDELLKIYEEQGIGDVSTEDVGFSYIEAAIERNGEMYFLCRW